MDARPRVLIIEDNADLLEILEHLLSNEFVVATADRGEDGVALAASFRPDIVILDMQLPQMDGIEAGRRIKRDLGDIPILVLTALASQGDPQAILASGCCDAYLAKPATLDAIRARVVELLASGAQAHG